MRLDLAFRLSSYLTLGLACVCLGYAERVFFVGFAGFVLLMELLLAAAFVVEGRWTLTPFAANVLGSVIAVGTGVWMAYQFLFEPSDLVRYAPLPVAFLPYLGPLLMMLLLAKLLRPKQVGDFWLLHGLGLLQVTLACGLGGDDLVFGLLLLAYLTCGSWSLLLFHLYRHQLADCRLPIGDCKADLQSAIDKVPWRLLGLWQAGRCVPATVALGLLFFWLLPPFGDTQWNPFNLSASSPFGTGHTDGGIDLNRTGTVKVSTEVVLVVAATDARGNPKLDLSPDQRWHGTTLDHYENGRWVRVAPSLVAMLQARREADLVPRAGLARPAPPEAEVPPAAPRSLRLQMPELSEQHYHLTFHLDWRKAGGLVRAEPVVLFPPNDYVPLILTLGEDGRETPWIQELDGTQTPLVPPRRREYRYRQTLEPPADPDVSAPIPGLRDLYIEHLSRPPAPEVGAWTDELLGRLVAAKKLRPADLARDGRGALLAANRATVARALSAYLATSGEFTYSLDLHRHDPELDPIVDFLYHVKQGHCERFASALALLLRALGVPSRVIKGFRGAESQEDGTYQVRQSHAHSWVEALLQLPGAGERPDYRWLTLDPTPGDGGAAGPQLSWSDWWEDFHHTGRALWKNFIVEYTTEQQSAAAGMLWQLAAARGPVRGAADWFRAGPLAPRFWASPILWLALGVVAGLASWWLRRARARPAAGPAASARVPRVAFYARLLAVLARRCRLQPHPAQTPQEFAATARLFLAMRPATAALADLPATVVALFYRIRYGRLAIPDRDRRAIADAVARLDTALAADGTKPAPV